MSRLRLLDSFLRIEPLIDNPIHLEAEILLFVRKAKSQQGNPISCLQSVLDSKGICLPQDIAIGVYVWLLFRFGVSMFGRS